MPGKTFPHDVYSLELIEAAYQIEATNQAHQLLEEYSTQCFEEIRFFYAMTRWQFNITQTENIIAQQTIQQLANLAGKYGDIKTKTELELELKVCMKKQ